MKRLLSVTALILSFSIMAMAETVSRKEATRLAGAFFNEANGMVMASPRYVNYGKRLTTDRLFTPFYVFNHPRGGFVIISAENKTYPILAYSLKDHFDVGRVDAALKALLTSYARDIENIRYDSRIPSDAIKAWNDYPAYVSAIVRAETTGTGFTPADSAMQEDIDRILSGPYPERYNSSLFTPDQWKDLVKDAVRQDGAVALAFPSGRDLGVAAACGYKGDYFRISFPSMPESYFRLHASELLSGSMTAAFDKPAAPARTEEKEEKPFTFYDSFIRQTKAEREAEKRRFARLQYPDEPSLVYNGLGHYCIRLPENVADVTVYNIMGAKVAYFKFRDTDSANIDISIQPAGFYFVQARAESGRKYGFKLVR